MACVKEGPPGPKGPDGPPYTWPPGNITGYVQLRDQFGVLMQKRDSVLLQTYNADSVFSAYTDSSGYFNIKAVPPGNYDIRLTKPGYDSLHLYVRHAGGEIDKFIGNVPMSQHVTTTLISLTAAPYQDGAFTRIPVELIFNWPAPPRTVVSTLNVYVDTSSVPGAGRYLSFGFPGTITNIDGVRGKMSQVISLQTSYLKPGTTLYLTGRVEPADGTGTTWYNYATGSWRSYPYLGDSIKTHITYN